MTRHVDTGVKRGSAPPEHVLFLDRSGRWGYFFRKNRFLSKFFSTTQVSQRRFPAMLHRAKNLS